MTTGRLQIGRKGEAVAEAYLSANGYRVEARNWRTSFGEFDLIAWDKQTLVFVEVRSRTGSRFGTPEESVNRRKQQKLRQLALAYLQSKKEPVEQFRFDVISVRFTGQTHQITHIPHAF